MKHLQVQVQESNSSTKIQSIARLFSMLCLVALAVFAFKADAQWDSVSDVPNMFNTNTGNVRIGNAVNYANFSPGGDLDFIGNAQYLVSPGEYAFRATVANYGFRFGTTDYEFLDAAGSPVVAINAPTGDLRIPGTGTYLVGGNKYAFKYDGAGQYGLYFNLTGTTYEFLDGSGSVMFGVHANNGDGKLAGGLRLGSAATAVAGRIQWTGTDFEGYDGTKWLSLTGDDDWSGAGSGKMYATSTDDLIGIGMADPIHKADIFYKSKTATPSTIVGPNGPITARNKAKGHIRLRQEVNTSGIAVLGPNNDEAARIVYENDQTDGQWIQEGAPDDVNSSAEFRIKYLGDSDLNPTDILRMKGNGKVFVDDELRVENKVRIGDGNETTPDVALHVVDGTDAEVLISPNVGVTGTSQITLAEDDDGTYAMILQYNGDGNRFNILGKDGTTTHGPHFTVERNSGNVGIGVSDPDQKLAVCGTVKATEVIVETGWCDYVFEDDYNLRPLHEVEEFIKANKHLPEIPAGHIIESEGVKLADMSSRFILKIEELTLYTIEQEKKINELMSKLEALTTAE